MPTMGFNSAFKGLKSIYENHCVLDPDGFEESQMSGYRKNYKL